MMYWNGGGLPWWAATLMWVGMLALWGVILWANGRMLVGVLRRNVGGPLDQPRRILDERLARGEIDTDEYHRQLEALTSNTRTVASVGGPR